MMFFPRQNLSNNTQADFARESIVFTKPLKADKYSNSKELAKLLADESIDVDALRRLIAGQKSLEVAKGFIQRNVPGLVMNELAYHAEGTDLQNQFNQQTKFLLSLGGDSMFVQLARLVAELGIENLQALRDYKLVGINSDPQQSKGALLSANIDQFPQLMEKIEAGDYQIELWPIMACYLDGKFLAHAISDINLGHHSDGQMSKYKLVSNQEDFYSSSGLLVTSGVGSMWMKGAGGSALPFDSTSFAYYHRDSLNNCPNQEVQAGESLKVNFIRANDLCLTIDGFQNFSFGRTNDAKTNFVKHELEIKYLSSANLQVIRLGE